VSTRAGEVHWTEIKKVMEDAMSYVHELLDSDTDCNGVISRVQERFGNYLTTRDVIKVVINGVRKYLDEVRYKDVNKYSRLTAEFMKCKELYSK